MSKARFSPLIEARIKREEDFAILFPSIAKFTLDPEGFFRGLTVFIGDGAAVVVGIKRFGDNGTPEIMWSSGIDFLDAMLNLETAVSFGKWRTDSRAMN